MSVINQNLLLTPEGYQISRSVRFRASASAYLNRTFPSAGNKNKWTYSGWVKLGQFTNMRFIGSNQTLFGTPSSLSELYLDGSNRLTFFQYTGGTTYTNLVTTQVFRDPSAWYHVVCIYDDAQATASNRVKFYVNGVQITSFSTASYPTQNFTGFMNEAKPHAINAYAASTAVYGDSYMTEINFVDGQALTPSSFGENDAVTGVWKPKKYAGTYGTNGFYLNFSDNSAATATAIGKDSSGNGNNWTPNNISVTAGVTYDSMLDVPTMWADGGNGRGNYCTLNPLDWNTTAFTLSNGNLTWTSTTTANGSTRGTMGMTTGKWYWEVTATSVGAGTCGVGIGKDGSTQFGSGQALYGSNLGNKYIDGVNTSYGATWATNNVIGVAYDADAGQITFYKDNVSQGAITLSGYAGVNVCPAVADGSSLGFTLDANFGQRPFAYTPPTGFKALNTQNLPDSTIKKGNQYFDATTYSGTSVTQSVVNAGAFQPDLVWIKNRSGVQDHILTDSVRGATKTLLSDLTSQELTVAGGLTAFNSNGFTVGYDGTTIVNASGNNYIGWQWKESASAGFDIVTWTGNGSAQTISHSLGVAPAMIIMKNRTQGAAGYNWAVYHKSLSSASAFLDLNTTAGAGTNTGIWNATAPTSTVFSVGTARINNGDLNVAYLFAEVAGFSKFGSYTGNGSTNGPFIHLGFRPRWVMVKASTTAGGGWVMHDTSRSHGNLTDQRLAANTSGAEFGSDGFGIDITSNGFKIRTSDGNWNASSIGYIFAAFAENPFRNALAR